MRAWKVFPPSQPPSPPQPNDIRGLLGGRRDKQWSRTLKNVEVGAVLIKKIRKKSSKIKILSMETVDMSMLSNSHLVKF
jgi:hypothetical protein